MTAGRWAIVATVVDPLLYAAWLAEEGCDDDAARVLGGATPPDVVVAWCDSEDDALQAFATAPPIPGVRWQLEVHRPWSGSGTGADHPDANSGDLQSPPGPGEGRNNTDQEGQR